MDAAASGTTWARARKPVLTRTELASGLAKRPYDLRHAGISFGLYSGVDPAECARRAGQSIGVLLHHYAKFLDGVGEQANRLMGQSMKEWDRVSQARGLGGESGFWSATGPEQLVTSGREMGGTDSYHVNGALARMGRAEGA